jgi:hypothetical protein
MTLVKHNKVHMIWCWNIKRLRAMKVQDQLARMGPLHTFTGPETTCGISGIVARQTIRDWVDTEPHKH